MNTTTTLHTSWSKDISFTKREIVDLEWVSFLENSPDISKDDKLKIRAWKKTITEGRYANITYKLGKNVRSSDDMLGRLCPLRGIGLQCFRREIRNALAHRLYWDIDIVSAQPTICLQLCEQKGLVCVKQREFLANRDELLGLFSSRDEGKRQTTALYFGGSSTGMPPFFQELHTELALVRKTLAEDPAWDLKFLQGKENRIGKAFSYILQTHERNCLLELDSALAIHGRMMDVLIHDGGLVRKREGETEFPEEILRLCEEEIKKTTGFSLSLVVKPMVVDWVLEKPDNTAYLERKEEFEKTHFKLLEPSVYGRVDGLDLHFKSLTEMTHCYGNMFVGDKKFIPSWIEDPNIRTYKRLAYAPGGVVEEDEYNMFPGFKVKGVQGDFSAYTELIRLIGNNESISMEYIENYVAHMFQKPEDKPKVCLVLKGAKGVGKDTFGDAIGKIMGDGLFWNTTNPENDIFSRFDGCVERALLVKFEEANFETNKNNVDQLKGIITADSKSFTRKGYDAVKLNNYARFIFTTNHDVPCVVDDGERRFAMFEVSAEKKGDVAFWDRIYDQLPKQASAYMYHLQHKDISTFNPRTFPETNYLAEVRQAFIPQSAKWFQRHIELNEDAITLEWKARDLLNMMNTGLRFPMTDTKFGREMKSYGNCLEKNKTRASNTYTADVEALTLFLKMKNWWVDL